MIANNQNDPPDFPPGPEAAVPAGGDFSPEQKQYLQGFMAGAKVFQQNNQASQQPAAEKKPSVSLNVLPTAPDPTQIHHESQDHVLTVGKKLCNEELAKRKKNPFDMWDEMTADAEHSRFPKGTDVFLYKYHGLFHVAPAQDSFMCRLRIPGGIMTSSQFRGVADLAESFGGGYADVTTRANLQIREIGPNNTINLLTGLQSIGLVSRGSGHDNIRNVTASPTAGIDRQELIDTRQLAVDMHHYILNHREMYGLPRKFNIAFDGGGTVSCLGETNDIGFAAVRVGPGHEIEPGVYFRVLLGGITGHHDFARDTGLLLKPSECVRAAGAMVCAFIKHGDRTDRKKARLKYVLDRMGFEAFLAESQKLYGSEFRRFPLENCISPEAPNRTAHVGIHPQRHPGFVYVGVVFPVGRMSSDQMRAIAQLAEQYGTGTIRLTVWQNLLISDIPQELAEQVVRRLNLIGIGSSATSYRAGLVACTGNAGCKFAASNTKAHGLLLASHLERTVPLDVPINIHLTGCHHSCAEHYIGDIGLLATKVARGEEMVEGYHVYLGGGFGSDTSIASEFQRSVPFDELPSLIEKVLKSYLSGRQGPQESFHEFAHRNLPELIATTHQGVQ